MRAFYEVKATEDILEQSIFEEEGAHVFIVEENGKPVGFALYFTTFRHLKGGPVFIWKIFLYRP